MLYINEMTVIASEEAIIQKIIGGEVALFEVLIRRYNPVLYKIARSYGFNHQDAEDIMQETHLAAYTGLPKFQYRSSYKTWIAKIAVNKCLYKLKYGYHKNEMPAGQLAEEQDQPMYMDAKNTQPEEKLLNRELAAVLEKSLQKIPVLYRTVFVLRQVEEYSVAETAELLGISTVNVKVRLNRAKALLQKEIEQVYSSADLYAFNAVYCDAMVKKVFDGIAALKQH